MRLKMLPGDFNWLKFFGLNTPLIGPEISWTETNAINNYLRLKQIRSRVAYKEEDVDIIVYTGGKTGSSSLATACVQAAPYLNVTTFQMHQEALACNFNPVDIIQAVRQQRLLIISSYREPISRNMSAFFQSITHITGMAMHQVLNSSVDELIQIFIREYQKHHWQDYHPFLDNDCKNIDNIDIFSKPFNQVEGYQVYQTEKVTFLQLRFDNISNWQSIIRENTHLANFRMMEINKAESKPINNLYRRFCNQIVLPKELLDDIFARSEQNLNYFYNQSQIDQLKTKWYSCLQD